MTISCLGFAGTSARAEGAASRASETDRVRRMGIPGAWQRAIDPGTMRTFDENRLKFCAECVHAAKAHHLAVEVRVEARNRKGLRPLEAGRHRELHRIPCQVEDEDEGVAALP